MHLTFILATLLALLSPPATPPSEPRTGIAARYSPGVMERVARVRHMPIVGCMVASPIYPLGSWVRVESLVNDNVLDCRVTDVSQTRDRPRHIAKRQFIELGYANTMTICGTVRGAPRECPVRSWPIAPPQVLTPAIRAARARCLGAGHPCAYLGVKGPR